MWSSWIEHPGLRLMCCSAQSTTSTLTQNHDELISRIKGLEEALLGEKAVREKMQSMLTLEAYAKDAV
eukprot:1768976-Rhodomonas_salina.1